MRNKDLEEERGKKQTGTGNVERVGERLENPRMFCACRSPVAAAERGKAHLAEDLSTPFP